MTREIKFRAWNGKKMERVGGYFWEEEGYGDEDLAAIPDYTLMQCTGLKDKNGKEIYEGDIVNVSDELGDWSNPFVVQWYQSGWWLKHNDSEIPHFSFDQAHIIEVIGNIYENKDLLE